MFDSIHAGRWLSQFTDQEIDFILFPSKKFRKIHPKLVGLLKNKDGASFKIAHLSKMPSILGYLDFLFIIQVSRILQRNIRVSYLRRILKANEFDFVHALEIQGAGYLCDEAIQTKKFRFILTNWGSDIFYFQHLADHLPKIKSVLAKADLYSAECQRDYKLALEFGFTGDQLPCIPNGGGLIENELSGNGVLPSSRNNIVVKTYGGTFGRGGLAIEAVAKVMMENRELTAYFYSVTDDLLSKVMEIKTVFNTRVSYSTPKNPISHKELEEIFLRSRIYIGCSISDGISTSFLEALANGVYPIQTSSSCAGEWVKKGAMASLIELDYEELLAELSAAVKDDKLVDTASEANKALVQKSLEFSIIKNIALQFYSFPQKTLQT
jgi:hypothetical protein